MNNSEKYNKIFISSFQVTPDQLKTLSYQSVTSWDSVGHMGLIASLEETFNIMVERDDIIDLSSYEKGKSILRKYNIEI
jgi:acyl carrier protein